MWNRRKVGGVSFTVVMLARVRVLVVPLALGSRFTGSSSYVNTSSASSTSGAYLKHVQANAVDSFQGTLPAEIPHPGKRTLPWTTSIAILLPLVPQNHWLVQMRNNKSVG